MEGSAKRELHTIAPTERYGPPASLGADRQEVQRKEIVSDAGGP
jgi:hypothetical protein